ncbi:UDP-N-acetylglucosamine--N-acetylmuramyl-(pentapeptide) pyrophosphoryl-undecaprenol N-acetylglucosamine transferase [Vallitalea longa]|uniref:UDP-N-acetylglucosamine--N-acetylmuramyl-(pentapeptide) pyrophosphoryl-undecaprenol N-acetylglucosamine transferase n=1 Tax=Vallitalea longa TaxID=2936439 RepID=A0A9W5Y8W6_9FIRM|nr:undecaprenyldiphospho-muramoylpentapeptide beta-N-acetylglucosaminyltransferase [Vallitalea longa]GKX28694.1 UDP-N-acetylglucosamine--N-acetylmuramyl-(pentapeptide) pyrophosphoryl-undecaprenol N-acetylglucosamine transferase [Vallitalea longa]
MKRIVLTGGGTAGHVTPNLALIPHLDKLGFDVHYIGSYNGIEKTLIEDKGIPYHGISSGKLRRYKDLKNLSDPFRVIKGAGQATKLIRKLKPDIVFSKGGFVTVPVILGAKLNRVPSIIHESDMTPGLANKISIPFATKVCTTFAETLQHLPENKAVLTGTPIREDILQGDKEKGLQLCKFNKDKPVLLMTGGSLGAVRINDVLREALDGILKKYQLVHLCGKNNLKKELEDISGYKQFEYVSDEMSDILAISDVVISRSGANIISELLALKKPHVLIPLPASASRGDQILNAASFEKHGYSYVLDEENMTPKTILKAVDTVYEKRTEYINHMNHSKSSNGISNILNLIDELVNK